MTPAELRQHVKRLRTPLTVALVMFLLGCALGALDPTIFLRLIRMTMSRTIAALADRSFVAIALTIFANNITTCYLVLLTGALLTLGPAIALLVNGAALGAILRQAGLAHLGHTLLLIIPHGVFELPAFLLAGALGFWCGYPMFRLRLREVGRRLLISTRIFIRTVVPLLLIAAFVEAFLHVRQRSPISDAQLIGTWKSEPDDRGLQHSFVFGADHTLVSGPSVNGSWELKGKLLILHLPPGSLMNDSDLVVTWTVAKITNGEMKLSGQQGFSRVYKRMQ